MLGGVLGCYVQGGVTFKGGLLFSVYGMCVGYATCICAQLVVIFGGDSEHPVWYRHTSCNLTLESTITIYDQIDAALK